MSCTRSARIVSPAATAHAYNSVESSTTLAQLPASSSTFMASISAVREPSLCTDIHITFLTASATRLHQGFRYIAEQPGQMRWSRRHTVTTNPDIAAATKTKVVTCHEGGYDLMRHK